MIFSTKKSASRAMANTIAFNETMHHTSARLRFIVSIPNEFIDFKHKTQQFNFCTDCFNKIRPKFKWIYHFYLILFERNKNCRYSNRITHKMMKDVKFASYARFSISSLPSWWPFIPSPIHFYAFASHMKFCPNIIMTFHRSVCFDICSHV